MTQDIKYLKGELRFAKKIVFYFIAHSRKVYIFIRKKNNNNS